MIEIGDKYYIFDLEKIYSFINYSDNVEIKEKEILDSYQDGKNISKTIREVTSPGNSQIDNIKYDLVKTFIIQIITYDGEVIDLDDVSFGTKLAWNTMINMGFLKEINFTNINL